MTNPVDHIALQALLRPARPALVDLTDGRRWSYKELNHAVAQWAAMLRSDFGIQVGDRVALLAKNRAEAILMHFACARLGAIFVPFNWRLSSREIAALIGDVRPHLVVGDAELSRTDTKGLSIADLAAAAERAEPLPQGAIDAKKPSLMLFTSGTSGHPKGALLSEWNLLQAAINFGLLTRVTPDSVFLVNSPMFHIMGLVSCVRSPLMQGGTILVSDGFEPARTLSRLSN